MFDFHYSSPSHLYFIQVASSFFPEHPMLISTSTACLNHSVLSMDNWYLFMSACLWSRSVYSSPCRYSPLCLLSTSIRSYNLIDIKHSLVLFQQNSKLSVQHSPWRWLNAIYVPTSWRFWLNFINRPLCKWQPAPIFLPGEFHGKRSLIS